MHMLFPTISVGSWTVSYANMRKDMTTRRFSWSHRKTPSQRFCLQYLFRALFVGWIKKVSGILVGDCSKRTRVKTELFFLLLFPHLLLSFTKLFVFKEVSVAISATMAFSRDLLSRQPALILSTIVLTVGTVILYKYMTGNDILTVRSCDPPLTPWQVQRPPTRPNRTTRNVPCPKR